jgi:hypothetical protein
MDDDVLDELLQPGAPRAQHELLVAALLHLMSHYTLNSGTGRPGEGPCVKLAAVIERHLNALARLPDADPVLRATCEQLSAKWSAHVDRALPVPQAVKRPLLARILGQGGRRAEPVLAT